MTILLKNKQTLQLDNFTFKCCIGRGGLTKFKKEGDKKTPKGIFKLENLYFREDKIYNKLFKIRNGVKHERLKRKDYKYDLLIPIKYNFNKAKVGLGSCIFLHLTNDYKPTAGCIALKKKDFLIMLKLIRKNTKIRIV